MAKARRVTSRDFIVLTARREDERGAKLGITASRRVGGAVQRNRVKRAIREWFRHDKHRLGGVDVVVIARKSAVLLNPRSTADELARLVGKANS
jgi:ribonuclease P protein component